MTTMSPTDTSPGGVAATRPGAVPERARGSLLLSERLPGRGSLAPSTHGGGPLLLGEFGGGPGSLAPPHRRRTADVTRVPLLEEALAAHVAALGKHRLERRRLRAVIHRLGLGGRPPLTLAEAGRLAGLSGERVRQLEARLRRQQREAPHPPDIPLLDAALSAVARELPMPASGVSRLLLEAGLTAGAFSAVSLCRAADLAGRELPFVLAGNGGPATVLFPRLAATAVARSATIEQRARRLTERGGASTMELLEQDLEAAEDLGVARRQLCLVLESGGGIVTLPSGWFTFRDARSAGPFVRASLRMLVVTPRLPVDSLRDGLRRHNAFRRIPPPPPADVLAEVYRHHPAFHLEDGVVSAVHPAPPDTVGPLNQRMVEILRAAPGGVLSRSHLLRACHEAGLNLTSVNLYTTYSECLERVGPGLFALRGAATAPTARPVVKRRRASRHPDAGPFHGTTPDGRPWLASRVTPSVWANGVVHVPAELRPVIEGRHFRCLDADGARVTTLGVDCHGNSWGWTAFLRRTGARVGDLARAVFDPSTSTAELEVLPGDSPIHPR